MNYTYSRKQKIEDKRNKKKAVYFILITLISFVVIIKFGVPILVKYVIFISELNKGNSVIEVSDTTPPAPPYLEALPEFTNKNQVDIKGSTEQGNIVKVMVDNEYYEIVSDSSGHFNALLDLKEGQNEIYAISIDQSGNQSQRTQSKLIIFDNTPPELTINSPKDKETFYGSSQKQLTIMGSTEAEVKLNFNGRLAIVESDGSFSYNTGLNEGENLFNITAEDQSGNKTESTLTLFFYY